MASENTAFETDEQIEARKEAEANHRTAQYRLQDKRNKHVAQVRYFLNEILGDATASEQAVLVKMLRKEAHAARAIHDSMDDNFRDTYGAQIDLFRTAD